MKKIYLFGEINIFLQSFHAYLIHFSFKVFVLSAMFSNMPLIF